jgi:hypothetical protein
MKTPLFTFLLIISLMTGLIIPAYAQEDPPTPEVFDDETIPASAVPSDTPEIWGEDAAPGLTHHTFDVFWAAAPVSCATFEFPDPCQIRRRTANGDASFSSVRTLHNAGNTGPFIQSNLAVDNTHVYWIGSDFQIRRLPRSATTSTAPEVIGSTAYTTATLRFEIDVDANYIFWTESNLSSPVSGRLYRMPKAGGERRLMAERTITGFGQGYFQQLRADGNGGAYYVSTFLNTLFHTRPEGSGFTSTALGIAGVASYTLSDTHIYWAEKLSNLIIKRAPRSNPSTGETLENRGNVGNPTAPVIAVDANNVYWQETRGSTGPIFRRSLTGGSPAQITNLLQGASALVSNGRYLFWNSGAIYRLPVNASTWTLDLEVSGLEVVQTIQNPTNDVPLVSGKETFVRVFPGILSSTPPRTNVDLWPNVLLYGTRGGTPLPGSPLEPVYSTGNPRSVGTTINRRDVNNGVWFRLPASWTDGTVQLRAVVNPRRVQAETNYTNNEITRSASFARKAPICLDIKPVSTERGVTITRWPRDEGARRFIQAFFQRAEQLLPTHELRVFMRGGDPLRKPRWYLVESDPFGLSRTNADSGWMLFLLKVSTLFDGNLCPDGGRTIRTVMAQDFPDREVNGMNLADTVLFFTFWEPAGGFAQNVPGGGVTLAHEIGHAYGRGHVNCPVGVPDGVDGGYPHPPCQIDTSGPNEHLGFDRGLPFSPGRTPGLLLPETTGDLMSYAHQIPHPRWTSNYTWLGIFNQINNRSSAVAAVEEVEASTPQSTLSFIVTGFISGTVAEMRESFELPEPLLSQVTAQINASTVESPDYRIRAFNGTTLLVDRPLRIASAEGDLGPGMPEPDLTGFFQRLDLPARPTRIEVVRVTGGSVIGGLNVSPNPPAVTITAPTAGSSVDRTLTAGWNASDPDGGLLHHMVRYSADDGATWTVIGQGLTASTLTVDIGSLPGGTGRIQVITTDGLNTAIATSAPFTVARRTPEVSILLSDGSVFAPGDPITLRSRAYDPEDGFLSGARLQWQVSGPINVTGDGDQLTLLNLPPGTYTARLQATDSDGNTGEETAQITVSPKRITNGAAPVVDGYCDDAAYNADPHPVSLRYNEGTAAATAAQVRFVRAGDVVYACFSGLPRSTSATEAVVLKFDVNNSADTFQQPDDVIFVVQRDGRALSGRGNGTTSTVFDPVTQGMIGAVSATATSWSAEIQIEVARLGGWNKLVRMLVAHDPVAAWPRGSVAHEPGRWGLTMLGEVSYRVNLPLVVR